MDILLQVKNKRIEIGRAIKRDIFEEYDYYLSLSKYEQKYVKKQMNAQPILYSLVTGAVSDAYKKIGQKIKVTITC